MQNMSESAEAARPVTGDKRTGASIGIEEGKGAGMSISARVATKSAGGVTVVGGEKSAGMTPGRLGGDKSPMVTINTGGEKSAGVTPGRLGVDKSAAVTINTGGEKSARMTPDRAGGDKSAGVTISTGSEKSAGMTLSRPGGDKSTGVSIGIRAEKSTGISRGIATENSARAPIGIGHEKSAAVSSGPAREKSAGPPISAGEEKLSVGVSIPDSVVAPLIGAGANVYIMTNELTQSMREKLGTWPFLQDTLNSRFAKLLAGGLLASVAVLVVWKIIKRFSAKSKTPADSDEDSRRWTTTKTYELTPVGEVNPQALRPEGDHAGTHPVHMLPHKIQLRIAETPLQAAKAGQPEICKARDPATRHRHTRHLDQRQGEQAAAESYSPWHSEPPHEAECSCPTEPQPRLLYSVRESHTVRRAVNLPDPALENLLTYTTCPSVLCPHVTEPVCPHQMNPKSYCMAVHPTPTCSAHVNLVPGRLSEGTPPLITHQHLFHSPFNEMNLLTTPSQLASSCLSHHHGAVHSPLLTGVSAGMTMPGGVSLCSIQETHPLSSLSGTTEVAACQMQTPETERTRTVESRARSVSQQTDGHPVEEDLDMPRHTTDIQQGSGRQTGPTVQSQNVPTRIAQSPVTPSQCTNTPIRTDDSQMHVLTSVTCPTHLSSSPQSFLPTVYQTPQGPMVQLSAGGECLSSYPGFHQQAMHLHTQHPSGLSGFSSTAVSAPSLPPLTYHQHVSIDPILPPTAQQQQATRLQTQQQQQQQPVVQHPSDSSVSQNSSDVCASQDARQYDGGQPTSGMQETAPPEVLAQERALLPQPPYNTGCVITPVSPPRAVMGHHHHHHHFPFRALTDFAHTDSPWQEPQSHHSYQPTPLCALGFQPPSSRRYSSWPAPPALFLPPSFASPTGGLLLSSPAGILAPPPGLLPPSHYRHLMANNWQSPYFCSQPPLPVATSFNPNFNLSNSNPHIFMQEFDQNTVQVLPFSQESNRIRVIASDHSVSSNQSSATVLKTQSAAISSSDVSIHTVAGDPVEPVVKAESHIAGTASCHSGESAQSCAASQTALATMEESSEVFLAGAVGPRETENFQDDGVAADYIETLLADPRVRDYVEETYRSKCRTAGSAANDGMETQL